MTQKRIFGLFLSSNIYGTHMGKNMLIVGLGNYGAQYLRNRHNAGFIMTDIIAKTVARNNTPKVKFGGQIITIKKDEITCDAFKIIDIWDKISMLDQILLFKPHTYMNLSGHAIHELIKFYKIPIPNVLVIHDDLDIQLGKIKIKLGGSSGGHNGVRSIDTCIGNGYVRMRIGIGRPVCKGLVHDYVLGNFKDSEYDVIQKLGALIANNLHTLLVGDWATFLRCCSIQKKANVL